MKPYLALVLTMALAFAAMLAGVFRLGYELGQLQGDVRSIRHEARVARAELRASRAELRAERSEAFCAARAP